MRYNIYYMDIRQKTEQRQKQVLSQSLVQSSKILELPLLDLRGVIEAEMEENPALEEDGRLQIQNEPPVAPQESPQSEEPDDPAAERHDRPNELANYEKPIPDRRESLHDSLGRQLRISLSDENDLKIGMALILQVDANGYLQADLQGLCEEIPCPPEKIAKILALIQTFDPPGIAARDLKECLLLQLDREKTNDPMLRCLVEEHLRDLAEGEWPKLLRKFKCTPDELQRKISKIHSLEPKPGRTFADEETAYVIPDITIEEKNDELTVSTREESLPILRINPLYRAMLRDKKVDETAKNFIREKIANGSNLMRAIRNRRDLLLRVLEIVAETQKEALTEGLDKLKPLSLKETAQKAGIHESTISRIVMNKYVQTPIGIFPLRQFFSTSFKTKDGEDVSSQSIRLK
ncbi:MAG: RNA polymerase factor sigma-54, partial [Candidatus Omnitrophica bacterium]|nr:RNA polymerase factor sigma-54 [Candidatus Omnitrophota bacterium]